MYRLPAYVGIILKKNNTVLLVKRQNTDWAEGLWNFPGGLLEEDETLMAAAVRETSEETGLTVQPTDFKLVHVMHVHKNAQNPKDILGFYFMAETWQGEAINNEPHRHTAIGWFNLNELPPNITDHALLAIQGLKNNRHYSENGWIS